MYVWISLAHTQRSRFVHHCVGIGWHRKRETALHRFSGFRPHLTVIMHLSLIYAIAHTLTIWPFISFTFYTIMPHGQLGKKQQQHKWQQHICPVERSNESSSIVWLLVVANKSHTVWNMRSTCLDIVCALRTECRTNGKLSTCCEHQQNQYRNELKLNKI